MEEMMQKPWIFLAAALLAAGLAPSRVYAWNAAGHMTVAKLAWDRLDAGQRDAAYQLLRKHPHLKEYFQQQTRPAEVSEPEWFFLNASTWADWLRGYANSKRPEHEAIGKYHKGPRHYINLPIILPADTALFKDRKLDPPDENIVTALAEYIGQLQNPKLPAAERAVALTWLLHLVGDIHQPLHCVAFFSKEYPDGDLGGNLRWVKDGDRPTRLHAYWDDLLGRNSNYVEIKSHVEMLTRAEFERDQFAERLKNKKYMAWAEEGVELARKYVYRDGDLPGLMLPLSRDGQNKTHDAPALPQGYAEEGRRIARQQIALAGHRLGDALNAVFAPKKP
jgi:S1/P1 Nuclease